MPSKLLANTDFTVKFEVIESPPGTSITPVDVTSQTTYNKVDVNSMYNDAPDGKNIIISTTITVLTCIYNGFYFSGAAPILITGTAEKVKVDSGNIPLRESDNSTVVMTGSSGSSTLQWVLRATIDNPGQSKVKAI